MWGSKLMPYDEDKQLHDEFEVVKYKLRLKSTLIVPVECTIGGPEE